MAQTPPEVVRQFLANTTNPMIVKSLVAEDATYVSLNYDNHDLKKIMPWTGTGKGPQAFVDTFARRCCLWPVHLQIDDAGKDRRIPLLDSFPCARWQDRLLPIHGGHLRDGCQLQIRRKFKVP